MYGHGFATLFLAECYGMSPRPELREKLDKAVKLIVNTQNKEGGWRYQPQREDADISVTVCQVMALRAARNAGLYVPKETIDRSIDYVKRSQNADGGFMYMLQGGEPKRVPALGRRRGRAATRRHLRGARNRPRARLPDAVPARREGHGPSRRITTTATTTPCRPCGRPAATAGPSGIRRSATTSWPGRADGSWQSPYTVDYATAMA